MASLPTDILQLVFYLLCVTLQPACCDRENEMVRVSTSWPRAFMHTFCTRIYIYMHHLCV
uniref:Uncharacterized protein n=1 Tax=Stegastes partitus TaxID=144197 RepID=A0A3B5AJC8_9TELE